MCVCVNALQVDGSVWCNLLSKLVAWLLQPASSTIGTDAQLVRCVGPTADRGGGGRCRPHRLHLDFGNKQSDRSVDQPSNEQNTGIRGILGFLASLSSFLPGVISMDFR